MSNETVTIYRSTEPQPRPGWRDVDDSVETSAVTYQVPREVWESYRAAEIEFDRTAELVGQYVLADDGRPGR